MKKSLIKSFLLVSILALFSNCKEEIIIEAGASLDDWTVDTHSNTVAPNYDTVFNQTKVNRLDIVLTSSEWSEMQSDLKEVVSGTVGQNFSEQTPEYFPCDLYFNGKQWYNVGVRYKGNSSLNSAYSSGNGKLPLSFDFDKFEDEYPSIKNQRFFGFKELTLGNSYKDLSLMRDKSANDLLREFGVPAVRTAFYEIYIDKGNGAEYYGLYTMDEIVFDTFLNDWFGSNTGNCYKPEGDGAKFATSGFNLDDFELKTNEDINDKSDIQALYNVLQASYRKTDATLWRTNLESVFDVDGFLKYLAANNVIQNWDTYGKMTHNFYLYHDPADDLLKWIPWDYNEAFSSGSGMTAVSLGMSEIGTSWPLINYIIADATYLAKYKEYVLSFATNTFTVDKMNTTYSNQQTLLYSSASKERSGYSFLSGISSFTSAVSTLKTHCSTQVTAAKAYAK